MSDEIYCYPPDFKVLRNRFNIRDEAELDVVEREFVVQRLREPNPAGAFDRAHLQAIHRHLFQDVYDWAGELRRHGAMHSRSDREITVATSPHQRNRETNYIIISTEIGAPGGTRTPTPLRATDFESAASTIPPQRPNQGQGVEGGRAFRQPESWRSAWAVWGSAGKKASSASSDRVTSTGVPNTVVVEKNDRTPSGVLSRNGTTTPP